jgi:hypothetical protein
LLLLQRREVIAQLVVAMLLAAAFEEMIPPVRESIEKNGLDWRTFALLTIFTTTAVRFGIGNVLHLGSDTFAHLPGVIWFVDFFVVLLEGLLLILLGSLTSVGVSTSSSVGFFDLLRLLCAIDLVWIVYIWLLGAMAPACHREFTPWLWALLNGTVLLVLTLCTWRSADMYSMPLLGLLAIGAVLILIADVCIADYYGLIHEKLRGAGDRIRSRFAGSSSDRPTEAPRTP